MTKTKFLKLLGDKLHLLKEKDRKKIIKKYSNIIDGKIKDGQTEKEATSSLNIDELTNDILSNFHSDSQTKMAAKETKQIIDYFEKSVLKYVKAFSNGIKNIYHSCLNEKKQIVFPRLMKVLIKVFLLLLVFSIIYFFALKLDNLNLAVLKVFPFFLKIFCTFIWHLLIFILYLSICLLLFIIVFKKHFITNQKRSLNEKENNNLIIILLKIIGTLVLLFPIWCINLVLIITIIFCIYLLCRGVLILGILLILLGLSFLFGFLADIINSFIYKYKKTHFFPFVICAIFIIAGSMVFTYRSSTFKYVGELNDSIIKREVITEEIITTPTEITADNLSINYNIDDSLQDNSVIIKIIYYDVLNIDLSREANIISIKKNKTKVNIMDLIIKDLKNKEIYNYRDLFTVSVDIYTNEETSRLLKTK